MIINIDYLVDKTYRHNGDKPMGMSMREVLV